MGLFWRVYWWWRPPGVVAWGGRPGVDWQLGSAEDRLRAARLARMAHLGRGTVQVSLVLRDAITPVLRDVNRQLREFGRVWARAQEGALRGAAAAGRTLGAPPNERS